MLRVRRYLSVLIASLIRLSNSLTLLLPCLHTPLFCSPVQILTALTLDAIHSVRCLLDAWLASSAAAASLLADALEPCLVTRFSAAPFLASLVVAAAALCSLSYPIQFEER